MLNKDQVKQKMLERGFSEVSRGMRNTTETVSIFFATEITEDNPSIGCDVDLERETFEFMYIVPCSINSLRSSECGSFMNDEHFDKIRSKFEDHASVLYRYFRKEL